MTPAARIAAAIELLDTIDSDLTAEKALQHWARSHRFAGSKDRAAIRDLVFDVLRAKRSLGAIGGGSSGRALMIGHVVRSGVDPDAIFNGEGYAPSPLSSEERAAINPEARMSFAVAADLPDWLWPIWQASLGDDALSIAQAQRHRAPISLRVNLRRTTREKAQQALQQDGIETRALGNVKTALQVLENERRIRNSTAYLDGWVELQDVASQKAVSGFDMTAGQRVLDYCAGGGGKALAFADFFDADVTAHDVAPQRMVDLPDRAARAGVKIVTVATDQLVDMQFDLVFCDAPCSGSGTWRRTPDAKWRFSEEDLKRYRALQAEVLAAGAALVARNGKLVYATCSVLAEENDAQIQALTAMHPEWTVADQWQLLPNDDHDGFFRTVLVKSANGSDI